MSDRAGGQERVIEPEFKIRDTRGDIAYFRLPESVTMVGLIPSKRGALRGNHFHPEQEQKLLIASGLCVHLSQPIDDPEAGISAFLARTDEIVVTLPRIAHADIFLEDTLLINLVNGERDLGSYDQHTQPHIVVEPEEIGRYALLYGVQL